ncbi:RNA-directed DNA polymerase, eukaryota, nucleotide-binding alpha-beta plait domain protein [Tanacetum coccineum]
MMAIGTGHRSNNYSESKRNDHLDNNRRQEQRNKGIPNKSHPNFREEHKSFSSIFVSNIPWNASVQDLWDICNKWGVVIDVYIAAKRPHSGHRFCHFNSYVKADPATKQVDIFGKYGTSNAGASNRGMVVFVGLYQGILRKRSFLNTMSTEGFDDVDLKCWGRGLVGIRLYGTSGKRQDFQRR